MKMISRLFLIGLIGIAEVMVVDCERNRVIVGVLAQEWADNTTDFYIAASHIKQLESAGARVVPIFIHKPDNYYDTLMSQLNGLLLPGSGTNTKRAGYDKAINYLLKKSIELNENGVYFPVWAVSISFEKMVEYFANTTNWFTRCDAENLALPTEFDMDITLTSKMFVNAQNVIDIMTTENVTSHYHQKCLNFDDFYRLKLDIYFSPIGLSRIQNVSTVSIIESKKYPFYGTSFNPERNQFEFVVGEHVGNVDHGPNAVLVGQFFANFFVNEARMNDQHFPDKLEELKVLIYNFNHNRIYTGNTTNSYFEEVYLFKESPSSARSIYGGGLGTTLAMSILTFLLNNSLFVRK